MKSRHLAKTTIAIAACVCACALAATIGCSSGSSSESDEPDEGSASQSAATSSEPAAIAQTSAELAPSGQQTEDTQVDTSRVTVENAAELGFQVFEGAVHVCTAEELIELQAIDIDPAAAGTGGTYAVLVFDQPIDVVGQGADGSGERTETCNMLGIAEFTEYESFVVEYGDLDACKAINGQRVTLAALTESIVFPSDVRFPIGEPSAKVTVVLS